MTYQRSFTLDSEPVDVAELQAKITENGITHVETTSGEVYRIFDRLNRKTVPINDAADGAPQRVGYGKVRSFGSVATAPEPTSRRETLQARENLERAFLQDQVSKQLMTIAKDSKAQIHSVLEKGEKWSVLNERGAEIGTFSRSNPSPTAVIADMTIVAAQAMDEGYELEDVLPNAGTAEYVQAVDVLLEHAPHLLGVNLTKEAQGEMAEKVLTEWKISGKVPHGWEVKEGGDGATSIRSTKLGKEVVARLFNQSKGLIDDVTAGELSA